LQVGSGMIRRELHRGEKHEILVHVIRENDDWRIANIIYDSGRSLIDHYRAITGLRS